MVQLRTDREYEDGHIAETLAIIDENCEKYSESAKKLEQDIAELDSDYKENSKKGFKTGDAATWLTLTNTISLYEGTMASLRRNQRARKKPYFGRIILTDEGRKESFYIGRGGINRDLTEQIVIDWRAPIANVYYENGLGKCSFMSPDGKPIEVDLELKRTFDITDGKLEDYFDSAVAANDELLNKYLARNKQAVLGEIIATIQKEQNDIIRKSPLHNVLVQGAAGSGKTTVAMHRISYILYNYSERIKPADFYIIGSNKMLLNYITGVLPELDVQGFRQMTMEDMFIRLVYNDWDNIRYTSKEIDANDPSASLRGQTKWFDRLKSFVDAYELTYIEKKLREVYKPAYEGLPDFTSLKLTQGREYRISDVILNRDCYCEGIEDGKAGIFDRSGKTLPKASRCTKLLSAGKIAELLKDNDSMSLPNKIATLNEWLNDNLEQELLVGEAKYSEKEMKEIRRVFGVFFGKKDLKLSVYDLYDSFLESVCSDSEGIESEVICALEAKLSERLDPRKAAEKPRAYDVYDLAALAYLYKRLIEVEVISEAHHIVVDEAQDYGMMAYRVLAFCVKDCRYTVMGDVSQNIRYDSGINDWQELQSLLISDRSDSFCTLRKSYRNTIEISAFATGILEHGSFEIYPVEPIIRHGKEPEIRKIEGDIFDEMAEKCREWQQNGLETIAVVCRDRAEAEYVTEKLGKRVELIADNPDMVEFGNGIMVLPVSMTKGLEFDAVLVYNPSREAYPVNDTNVKLFYVAVTRALHELCILYTDDLTGLITDDVSAERKKQLVSYKEKQDKLDRERLGRELKAKSDTSFDIQREEDYVKNKILLASSKKTTNYLSSRTAASPVLESYTTHGQSRALGVIAPKHKVQQETRQTPDVKSENSKIKFQGSAAARTAGRRTESEAAGGSFANEVPDSRLAVPGHAIINQAIKMVSKQKDGIFFTSRYGMLRVFPIGKNVARVTFIKALMWNYDDPELTKKYSMSKDFVTKEKGGVYEIAMPGLSVCVDKMNGSITYRNGKGRELLKERNTEPRYLDESGSRCFTYYNVNSADSFHLYNGEDENHKYLHNKAYVVNPDNGSLPYIMKKDCYAILPVSTRQTIFANKPGMGTFSIANELRSDIYFISADSTEELLRIYSKLIK